MPPMFGAVASVREYILNLAGSTSNAGFGGLITAILLLGPCTSDDRRAVMTRTKQRWSDFSPAQQAAIIVGGAIEIVLTAAA